MSNYFPLYDNIKNKIKSKKITINQKKELQSQIEKLNKEGHELIFAVIKHFYIVDKSKQIPIVSGDINTNGDFVFNLDDFENDLLCILIEVVNVHNKSLMNV